MKPPMYLGPPIRIDTPLAPRPRQWPWADQTVYPLPNEANRGIPWFRIAGLFVVGALFMKWMGKGK